VGCPTSAREFATAIWKMPDVHLRGVYHWANTGSGSWYDFAAEIARIAKHLGLFRERPDVNPVTTAEYAQRAKRPVYSVLDPTKLAGELKVRPLSWQQALLNDMRRGFSSVTGPLGGDA
jgi:dTDP-4-dehydrorhamnose reductase